MFRRIYLGNQGQSWLTKLVKVYKQIQLLKHAYLGSTETLRIIDSTSKYRTHQQSLRRFETYFWTLNL